MIEATLFNELELLGVGIHKNLSVEVTVSKDRYTLRFTNEAGAIHTQTFFKPDKVYAFQNETEEQTKLRADKDYRSGISGIVAAYAYNQDFLKELGVSKAEFVQSFNRETIEEFINNIADFVVKNPKKFNIKLLYNYKFTQVELPCKSKVVTKFIELYDVREEVGLKITEWEKANRLTPPAENKSNPDDLPF